MILEGASALVSVVLLAWLFLWFLHQRPNPLAVRAFVVPSSSGDVPYLEADARGFSPGMEVAPTDAARVAKAVGEAVAGPSRSPLVVTISAPATDLGGASALEIVREVARQAGREVLVVLDMAQVGTDRDRGVFGNAPYLALAEGLRKLEKPKGRVAVLCSGAPGQKSWMIDGIGRSAFSYFVQAGLAGAARAESERGTRAPIRVEDLHRFVLANTSRWVADHRRGARQTPTLLAVGPDAESFAIPAISRPTSTIPLPPPEKEEAKAKDEKPSAPPVSPGERLLTDLGAEWERHETLALRARPPWRDAPARWRVYQASLLRAERLARASRDDAGSIAKARDALEIASHQSRDAWASDVAPDRDFPLRPIGSDEAAGLALNESLKLLTGIGSADLPSAPAAKPTVGTDPAPKPAIPGPLEAAARGEAGPFLEFQLPGWARRFEEEFRARPFGDGDRGDLLRRAVLARRPAESALAADRRGLARIVDEIKGGDAARRSVQDDLFGPLDGDDAVASLRNRIAEFERVYKEAGAKIGRFHDARSTFERIAAKLPALGEWAILDDLRSPDPARDESPSPRLMPVFLAAEALAAKLAPDADPAGLDEARRLADEKMKGLEAEYDRRVREVLGRADADDWRDLDDLLATPWIAPKLRMELVRRAIKLEATPPDSTASAAPSADSADPNFLREARGMARLELALRNLGLGKEADARLEKARLALPTADPDPADSRAVAEALGGFVEAGRKLREETRSFAFRPGGGNAGAGGPPEMARVWAEVFAADRDVRTRGSEALKADPDRAASDLEALAAHEAIRFHADRLALDFIADVRPLDQLADDAYPPLKGRRPGPPRSAGRLAVDVTPGRVRIDPNSRSAGFDVSARVEGERDPGLVPPGRAFVAVSGPPREKEGDPKQVVLLVSPPGRGGVGPTLAGALVPIGSAPGPAAFKVSQETTAPADGQEVRLSARAFYRGRLSGEDGRGLAVAVDCRLFGDPVTIEIRQDLDALKRRFRPELTRLVTDQFPEHPGAGYLHRNGRLDYILTVANATPKAHRITIEQTFQLDDAPAPADKPDAARAANLEARGDEKDHAEVKGAVTAGMTPVGKRLVLLVVAKEAGIEVGRRRFTFEQLSLDRYLGVDPRRDLVLIDGDLKPSPCFVVNVTRLASDPVTDPIDKDDLRWLINDRILVLKPEDIKSRPNLDRGDPVRAYLEIKQGTDVYNWSVILQGHDEKKGSTPVR